MKKLTTLFIASFALISTFSCDALHSVSDNSVVSQGAPYELIIVSDQPQWEGALGDTLRSIFTAPIPYLQQREPLYDILRVTNQGFKKLVTKHRNIFKTVIDPSIETPQIALQYDLNATPQIVLTLQGASEEAITQYVSENREKVIESLERAERERAIKYGEEFNVKSLEALIEKKFNFEMKIPKGYNLRAEGDDYLWISYEYPTASQGLIIYSYPANQGMASLRPEKLIEARNRFTAKIPGPADGSYMTTFAEYTPDSKFYDLDGRIWCELRGLWEVEGDFMGGPFVSYSTYDEEHDQVVTIDGYVYSPKLGKRNFIRGIEHLIYNVEFPEGE